MLENFDFEINWLDKFSNCLDVIVGIKTRKEIMQGSEYLSKDSNREVVINWSKKAMEKLDSLVEKKKRIEIMTGCACQYPKSQLLEIREMYEKTKNIEQVHQMLQNQFESLLNDTLKLDSNLIKEIVNRGWGSAGIIKGKTVTATKIPKSGYLIEYFNESDPEKKRQIYCHCPRVRDILKSSDTISSTYCYCGAGFYKKIWEEILQKPVKVEILESVINGDNVCKFLIKLP